MYLLQFYTRNADRNGDHFFAVEKTDGTICKWTLLPADSDSEELLRLIALASCGAPFAPHLPHDIGSMFADPRLALRVGYVVARHILQDGRNHGKVIVGNVLRADGRDGLIAFRNDSKDAPFNCRFYARTNG